jgi:hypothetical protein
MMLIPNFLLQLSTVMPTRGQRRARSLAAQTERAKYNISLSATHPALSPPDYFFYRNRHLTCLAALRENPAITARPLRLVL